MRPVQVRVRQTLILWIVSSLVIQTSLAVDPPKSESQSEQNLSKKESYADAVAAAQIDPLAITQCLDYLRPNGECPPPKCVIPFPYYGNIRFNHYYAPGQYVPFYPFGYQVPYGWTPHVWYHRFIPQQPMVPLQPQFPVFNQQIQPVAPVANANPFPPAGLIGGQNQDRLKNEILHRAHVLKASTPDGRTRADRLIASGDQSFWDQKYGVAASKYRDAIAKAPDYPEAHFRLAHAKFAIGHFDSAFTEFLLALELAGSGDRPYFSLEQLYLGDKLAKQQHFDRLNDAMLREPSDGSLVFLYALCLHYDGRPLEARELFVKSSTLAGTHRDYIHHFLPVAPIAEPPL